MFCNGDNKLSVVFLQQQDTYQDWPCGNITMQNSNKYCSTRFHDLLFLLLIATNNYNTEQKESSGIQQGFGSPLCFPSFWLQDFYSSRPSAEVLQFILRDWSFHFPGKLIFVSQSIHVLRCSICQVLLHFLQWRHMKALIP